MLKIFFFTLHRQIKVRMNRLLLYAILTILYWLPGQIPASAQRTSDGTFFIGAAGGVSCYRAPSGGAGLECGRYMLGSLWKAGVRAVDWNQFASASGQEGASAVFDHVFWTVDGGWLYRLWGSYGRAVSVYAGACAFLGVNQYEVLRPLPSELDGGFPRSEFIYGVEPAVEIEAFPFRRVAAVLSIQSPLTFGSTLATDLWHLFASVGVRINI